MECFEMNSISRKYCQTSDQEILESLDSCKECGDIPLPSFKSTKDKNNTFCKGCYHKQNLDEDSLILPSKLELITINKLKISCEHHEKGCKQTFSIKEISDLLRHEKKCGFSNSNLGQKEDVIMIDEYKKYCKRCTSFYYDSHDCITFINTYINKIMSTLSNLEYKTLLINETFMQNINSLHDKVNSNHKIIEEKSSQLIRISLKKLTLFLIKSIIIMLKIKK